MRRSWIVPALAGVVLASPAGAYEYRLQFGANSGARNLVVAGYAFQGDNVLGNCSYSIVSGGGSGRGGGYHSHTTYFNQTCTWDRFGNLLGITQGAPTAPAPLSTTGGLTIYARNAAGDTTGIDTAHGGIGFVNTPSAQYTWLTQPSYVFLPSQSAVNITLKLQSEGDFPLIVGKIEPVAQLAKVSVRYTSCIHAPVRPGHECTIVVRYDPTGLPPGDDPYTAHDSLTVNIVTNAGQAPGFSEPVEVPVAPGG